jgi:glycosyltransferase involved in cell wall biosynthesis
MKKPRIAILTSTYSSPNSINKTIESIEKQTYDNWIHLVKPLNDNVANKFNEFYNRGFSVVIPGDDRNIFDALNVMAKSDKLDADWVIVIQDDDQLYDENVLENVSKYLSDDVDLVYGCIESIHYSGVHEIIKTRKTNKLWNGMLASHQAIFVRTKLLLQFPYDLTYSIASDYDFLWKCYKSGFKFKETSEIISRVDSNGLASREIVKNYKQKFEILKKYDSNIFHRMYWRYKIGSIFFRSHIKKILPKAFIRRVKLLMQKSGSLFF